ncbi:MAG: hypothetical protein JG776_388 [Caloramator sp.]|jgi:urease gamma subunit|nr:hypothetical protein [Caloramator sp.]
MKQNFFYDIIKIQDKYRGGNMSNIHISHNNNDIILKYMAEAFKDTTLEFLGIKLPKIKSVIPTDLPIIDVKEEVMDFVFLLEDDSLLHLEFQTTYKKDDLIRFNLYDLRLYKKERKPVRTIVIYSADINDDNIITELRIGPNKLYKVEKILMKRFDGDRTLEHLKSVILSEKELTELDKLNLIFLPLMKSKKDKNELAITAVELAKEINDKDLKMFCISAIIAISDKFIDKEYINKLKEVFEMTKVGYLLKQEGIQQGIQQGINEGIIKAKKQDIEKFLNKKFKEDLHEIIFLISKINNIEALDKIFDLAIDCINYEDFKNEIIKIQRENM